MGFRFLDGIECPDHIVRVVFAKLLRGAGVDNLQGLLDLKLRTLDVVREVAFD